MKPHPRFLRLCLTHALALAAAPVSAQVIGGGGGAAPAPRQPRQNMPLPTGDASTADKLVAEGRYGDAARIYSDIIRKSPGRAPLEIYLKLGDASNQIAGAGMMNAVAARNAWEAAVKEYPNAPEPYRRLVKFFMDYAEISLLDTRLDLVRRAGAAAQKLTELDPNDAESALVVQQSIIDPFLFDRSSDVDAVEAAIARLRELETKLPNNIDVPFFIARAQAKMGSNYLKFGRHEEGAALVKAGLATIDRAIAQHPGEAGPLFRKAQIIQAIGVVAYNPAANPTETELAEAHRLLSSDTADLLSTAVSYLKEDDRDLESIVSFAVQVQRAAGNDLIAENLLRAIIQIRPSATTARIQLSELLSENPARIEEILPVIEPACVPPKSLAGIAGIVASDSYRQALMVAVRTRIDLYTMLEKRVAAGDAAAQQESQLQLRKTRAELETVVALSPPNAPRVLRLLARLALADKDPPRAIQLFNRALPAARELDISLYADTLTMLGKAQIVAGDPDAARKSFEDAIGRADYAVARVALVRLMVDQQKYPEARPLLDRLRTELPGDPDVQELQADILRWESRGNATVLAGLLDQLPEEHAAQKLNKSGVASRVGQTQTAIRIADDLIRQFPTDPRVVVLRADVLIRAGDTAAALQTLQAFDSKGVQIPQIQALIAQLSQK